MKKRTKKEATILTVCGLAVQLVLKGFRQSATQPFLVSSRNAPCTTLKTAV